MAEYEHELDEGITPVRVSALTDGVFAIAMTLLVLDLRLPDPALFSANQSLISLAPNFITYFISFVVLGVYWAGHHNFFHFVKRIDRPMLWLNILFLMLISLLPFTTIFLRSYPSSTLPSVVYGINLVVIGMVLYLGWTYATRHHHLVDKNLKPEFIKTVTNLIKFAPKMYTIAILLAFFNPTISLVIYAIVPLYFIIPNQVDRHLPGADHSRHHPGHEHE